jgi:hypothetical protein
VVLNNVDLKHDQNYYYYTSYYGYYHSRTGEPKGTRRSSSVPTPTSNGASRPEDY